MNIFNGVIMIHEKTASGIVAVRRAMGVPQGVDFKFTTSFYKKLRPLSEVIHRVGLPKEKVLANK